MDLHNDPIVLHNITHPDPITMEQHLRWWNSIKGSEKQMRLLFVDGDERIGFTKFYDIDRTNRNCVLGADIMQEHRGKGYAKPMWNLMLSMCFDTMNMHRVSLTVAEFNHIGYHVYKSVGFKEEGRSTHLVYRDGRYWDHITMYMLEEDWKNKQ